MSPWADLFFLLSEYSFGLKLLRPLLLCSQFWSGLSGLAGLRCCKYHIQTARCFFFWKRGGGKATVKCDDHFSRRNLTNFPWTGPILWIKPYWVRGGRWNPPPLILLWFREKINAKSCRFFLDAIASPSRIPLSVGGSDSESVS